MSDPRPADQPPPDRLRTELEAWLNQQNQALLEEVIATWEGAMARFRPDPALLARLRESLSPAASLAPREEATPHLGAALDLLEEASSQSDLLRRLLDGLAPLVERSALFILKQGQASLYAQRGFEAEAAPRTGAVVPPADLEALVQGQVHALRRKGPAYSALLSCLSPYEAAEVAILPLRHRRKAVALLLVDSGLRQRLDHPEQIRALVLAASALLAALATGREEVRSGTLPGLQPASAPAPVTPDPPPAPPGGLDPRTRASAERLARVLVGDVELYFPAKVAQARAQGNLYGLLRDELDRSRATFVDRFGENLELEARIFTSTVIQQLCDGNAAKLGAAPWGHASARER